MGCNHKFVTPTARDNTSLIGIFPIPCPQQIARSLPDTVVFFDKFCPDLHGTAAAAAAAVDGTTNPRAEGGAGHPSPSSPRPSASRLASGPLAPSQAMAAACRWCSKELGNASVFVLSDDDAGEGRTGGGGGGVGGGGEGGDGGGETRVLGLRDFLRLFVAGGEEAEGGKLARRGDLLLAAHLANKVKVGYTMVALLRCTCLV